MSESMTPSVNSGLPWLTGNGDEAQRHDRRRGGLALREQLPDTVGAVGLARVRLGEALAGELLHELQGRDVLRAVDRPLVALLPVAAVAPHPERELRLGLF